MKLAPWAAMAVLLSACTPPPQPAALSATPVAAGTPVAARPGSVFLGLQPAPVTPDLAKELELDRPRGLYVFKVVPEGAAARNGIQKGDVVLSLNGRTLAQNEDLGAAMAGVAPGSTVPAVIWRNGREERGVLKL